MINFVTTDRVSSAGDSGSKRLRLDHNGEDSKSIGDEEAKSELIILDNESPPAEEKVVTFF